MVWIPGQTPVGLRPKKSQCFYFSPKTIKHQCPSSVVRQEEFPPAHLFYYLALQLLWGSPATIRSASHFTRPTLSDVTLIQKYHHSHTQIINVWPEIWAPRSSVKLTHTISHHCPGCSAWLLRGALSVHGFEAIRKSVSVPVDLNFLNTSLISLTSLQKSKIRVLREPTLKAIYNSSLICNYK